MGEPCLVPRSLLVSEEMRSLIVEKGPGPVEEDPDALVKGGCSVMWASVTWMLLAWVPSRGWQDRAPMGWMLPRGGTGQSTQAGAAGAEASPPQAGCNWRCGVV